MRPAFIASPAHPLDELDLCRWIGSAAPGDILEYHRGFLAIDIGTLALPPARQRAFKLLAGRAAWAAENGFIHLVQRRLGPSLFGYLAIKRPRGFIAPPSIDPEGGEVGDLRRVGIREVISA